ncbi:MAG: alpha/beta hydrolase family protein [Alphaproteobacteria bacterium]
MSKTFERPYDEVRDIILARAKQRRNPCDNTVYETVQAIMDRLTSVARDPWAAAFSAAAEPFEARAHEAEARGDDKAASEAWKMAYGFYRVARYPAPNSAGKIRAYKKSQEAYVNMESYAPVKLQIVRIPFSGKAGEGGEIRAYLRLPQLPGPHAARRHPVVMIWGGIDSFKEERRTGRYVKAGFATLSIDMPGVGEAPLAGSIDAERMWDPIFDWIATRPELDAKRVAAVGCSTGGYWATKLAHTHKDRLAAAVNHGGPAHHAFKREWIEKAAFGEYPFELAETLACAFGRATFDEWVDYAPKLSLLDMGLLDRPCAPLLCVNGVDDSVFPIADHHLLLEHGEAKSARFFPGGHMGHGDGWDVTDILISWLTARLAPAAR